MERTFIETERRIDLELSLGPLRHGRADLSITLAPLDAWRALRTPQGAATFHARVVPDGIQIDAWGPGAGWTVANAADLVGANDDPSALTPKDETVTRLAHSLPGLRLPRGHAVSDVIVPAIIEQKVTGYEAKHSLAALTKLHGEKAPGPRTMYLLPTAATIAELPYWALHPIGLERKRAGSLIRAAARIAETPAGATPETMLNRLRSVSGVGPWTLSTVSRQSFGDPDAVIVGDYHLPHEVAWAMLRKTRSDDAEMLRLLEPYAGQRGRVQRLIEAGGGRRPRRMPRRAARSIANY